MMQRKTIVLDSRAIMAFFEDEPAAEKIANIIADARDQDDRLLMSVVNIGEVWYAMARRHSERDADEAIRELRSIGIEFIDADWPLTKIAASYKVRGGISYADCHAAALAKHHKATLLTGDDEFKQLNDEITIEWL